MRNTLTTAAVALVLGASFAQGATLIDFTMSEHDLANNTTVVLTDTSTLAAGISSPSAQPNGTFGTGGGGTQDGELNWSSWDTDAEFLTVEFTVDAGKQVDLSDLTLDISRNGGGAAENWYAVVLPGTGLAGAALGAAVHHNVQAVAISGNAGGSVGATQAWDLSAVGALAPGSYTIGLGTPAGAGGNMRFSDIVVNGRVSDFVPEPGTLCLFGLGLLGLVSLRRRQR